MNLKDFKCPILDLVDIKLDFVMNAVTGQCIFRAKLERPVLLKFTNIETLQKSEKPVTNVIAIGKSLTEALAELKSEYGKGVVKALRAFTALTIYDERTAMISFDYDKTQFSYVLVKQLAEDMIIHPEEE